MSQSQPAAIAIPLYKEKPDRLELLSLQQCMNILHQHPFIFFVPESLNTIFYQEYCANKISFKFQKFKDNYFSGLKSYNKLMMSPVFYRQFSMFEYILIYQLDAWVFRDELLYWCKKGYDYIGAPWFKGWDKASPGAECIGIGNGGLSLRKVSSHRRVLHSFSYIKKPRELFNNFKINKNFNEFTEFIKRLTIKNNTFYLFNDYKSNEDYFWGSVVPANFKWFKLPPVSEALKFSIEVNPSHFIKKEEELPFGCHAWQKYEPEFWKKYIPF